MKKLFLILAILSLISCKPTKDFLEGRKTEPITTKSIQEFNVDPKKYNVRLSKKLFFEHKYSEPNKNNDPNYITENIKIFRNCIIKENDGDGLTVKFQDIELKFKLNSKGMYEIIENQEYNGDKFKLIKGKGTYLTMKVKRLNKNRKIKGEKQ